MDHPSLPWSRGADFLWNRLQKGVKVSKDGVGLDLALAFLVSNDPGLVKEAGLVPAIDLLADQVCVAKRCGGATASACSPSPRAPNSSPASSGS